MLLVEDDRELADYVRRGLEEEYYSVTVCFDGGTGLHAAELSNFDIIVLDIMLPFMDGLNVTRRLRRRNMQTPILRLTGRDSPEDVGRGLDAGADDYLTKPFSFEVLLARIRARTRKGIRQSAELPVVRRWTPTHADKHRRILKGVRIDKIMSAVSRCNNLGIHALFSDFSDSSTGGGWAEPGAARPDQTDAGQLRHPESVGRRDSAHRATRQNCIRRDFWRYRQRFGQTDAQRRDFPYLFREAATTRKM